jgi:hypothetical protein
LLTISTMTIRGHHWLRRTFVPDSATGAASCKRNGHKKILLFYRLLIARLSLDEYYTAPQRLSPSWFRKPVLAIWRERR